MAENARRIEFEKIELFGKPALFTNSRLDRGTVPAGLYCYNLRGSDNDPGRPISVEDNVGVNHAGTVITREPLTYPEGKLYCPIGDELNFLGENCSLKAFCAEQRLPQRIAVRNIFSDEDLGRFVAISSIFNADPRFPEESWPYLDYTKIGAEHRLQHDGYYTEEGYNFIRQEPLEEELEETEEQTMGGL